MSDPMVSIRRWNWVALGMALLDSALMARGLYLLATGQRYRDPLGMLLLLIAGGVTVMAWIGWNLVRQGTLRRGRHFMMGAGVLGLPLGAVLIVASVAIGRAEARMAGPAPTQS